MRLLYIPEKNPMYFISEPRSESNGTVKSGWRIQADRCCCQPSRLRCCCVYNVMHTVHCVKICWIGVFDGNGGLADFNGKSAVFWLRALMRIIQAFVLLLFVEGSGPVRHCRRSCLFLKATSHYITQIKCTCRGWMCVCARARITPPQPWMVPVLLESGLASPDFSILTTKKGSLCIDFNRPFA